MTALPRLHVLTDELIQERFTHAELARLAARGGAGLIQLREKRPRTTRALVELCHGVRAASGGCLLVVNDRADVAVEAGADGVHLGREDLRPTTARSLLGEGAVIGATANSLSEALLMDMEPVTYLGVGPVFGTTTKANPAPTLGIEGLARICAAVRHPVIAIGAIDAAHVGEVLQAGAWGVAVVGAVVKAADPAEATTLLVEEIERWTRRAP